MANFKAITLKGYGIKIFTP